jgi:hypothetical protein
VAYPQQLGTLRVPHDSPLSRKKYADLSAGILEASISLIHNAAKTGHVLEKRFARPDFTKERPRTMESTTISVSSLA